MNEAVAMTTLTPAPLATDAIAPRSLDHFVTLGRSGLRVSPLCLGAMTFGEEWGFGVDAGESFDVIGAYLEHGGNFIDTANVYTKGHSEAIIGDYFADGPGAGRRDRVVIATKFMGNMHAGDPNGGGGGRKAIMAACDESLRRLRTDYIDLYWAHFWDRHTPIDEMMQTLDDLVRAGKVRYIGISDHPAWVCVQAQYEAQLRGWTPLVALQIEYSLLQRTVEADLMPMARALNLGVTPWSPLRAGILTGKYTRENRPAVGTTRVPEDSRFLTDKTYDLIEAIIAIADELGTTPARVSLQWVQSRQGVTSTILGARTVDHLLDNVGALGVELTAEHVQRLDDASAVDLPFPCEFVEQTRHAIQNGANVNGLPDTPWTLGPANDGERW
jgi:aryl-alcohol dehydrogenase-like predicted oxidoreductase